MKIWGKESEGRIPFSVSLSKLGQLTIYFQILEGNGEFWGDEGFGPGIGTLEGYESSDVLLAIQRYNPKQRALGFRKRVPFQVRLWKSIFVSLLPS